MSHPTMHLSRHQRQGAHGYRPRTPCGSDSSEELVVFSGRSSERQAAVRPPETIESQARQVPHRSVLQTAGSKNQSVNLARQMDQLNPKTNRNLTSREHMAIENYTKGQIARVNLETNISKITHSIQVLKSPDPLTDQDVQQHGNDPIGTTKKQPQRRNTFNGWTSSDIEDLQDLSTSEELQDSISRILAERHRNNEIQYLVVWEGQSVDEARWIPATSLVMRGAQEAIENFGFSTSRPLTATKIFEETEGSDSWESEYEIPEKERLRHGTKGNSTEVNLRTMSDAQMARLLAKQEELGIGSEEVILFDEAFYKDREVMSGTSSSNEGEGEARRNIKKSMRDNRRIGQRRGSSGKGSSAIGVPKTRYNPDGRHGNFDPVDFYVLDKLSAKGNAQNMPNWDISDSELEEALFATWHADRNKKKEQKLKREEMRMQGLLGKPKGTKSDSRDKHRSGIVTGQIKSELENFLFSGEESYAFPPMDKRDRKSLHEIASLFKLKSMSKGSGRNRFPVLYKTKRTHAFDSQLWARLESHLDRKFSRHQDFKASAKKVIKGHGGDVSYREGEIVGGTAAELSADNRGRAMLERMGWTTGTALGTRENKGMLDPITHVVKKTRAGLG